MPCPSGWSCPWDSFRFHPLRPTCRTTDWIFSWVAHLQNEAPSMSYRMGSSRACAGWCFSTVFSHSPAHPPPDGLRECPPLFSSLSLAPLSVTWNSCSCYLYKLLLRLCLLSTSPLSSLSLSFATYNTLMYATYNHYINSTLPCCLWYSWRYWTD